MRLLDAKEVAEILQVNVQRVYELTRQGILPSIRIGPRQIRFEETRLMQWIEHGGRLNAEGLEAKLAAEEGLGASGADSSRGRNRSGNLNPFALSLSVLFAPARTVDKGCCAQLTSHQFVVSIGSDERGQAAPSLR